jgi:hypothetical protein
MSLHRPNPQPSPFFEDYPCKEQSCQLNSSASQCTDVEDLHFAKIASISLHHKRAPLDVSRSIYKCKQPLLRESGYEYKLEWQQWTVSTA